MGEADFEGAAAYCRCPYDGAKCQPIPVDHLLRKTYNHGRVFARIVDPRTRGFNAGLQWLLIGIRSLRVFFSIFVLALCPAVSHALEEVIVSAQHREESLTEVPIGITVLDGADLQHQGITRIEDFTALAPGLSGWEQGVSTPIYAIRGISTNSFGIGGEASVAVVVDDSYVGRINSTSLTMLDVNRVEVLRGPQGTLFGRNATAGAIIIYNNQPVNQFEGRYALRAGEYDALGGELTVNQPLYGERLMLRASVIGGS